MNYYGNNNQMMNQLMRQRDSIDNLISQYSQPQAPIQNIINQNGVDFEARILANGEDISNIIVNRKTLFVDEKNKKVLVKELDGTISKTYDIIIPKDEKDIKIEELQNEVNKLKEVIENGEFSNIKSTSKIEQSAGSNPKFNGNTKQ